MFTWGHRLVTPRRVVVARSLKKSENTPLKFHRSERLHVVSIAAGMIHSMALTHDGALFYWVSSDPDLRCQQVHHHHHHHINILCSEVSLFCYFYVVIFTLWEKSG